LLEQATPQAEQLPTLVSRLTSQPSAARPLQSPHPSSHAATVHEPSEQTAVAWAREHRRAQAPQFWASDLVFTSQPSEALRLQSAVDALHGPSRHTPP
jgi:hypothetical protein